MQTNPDAFLRSPLRALKNGDANAVFHAYTRIWAALALTVVLSSISLSGSAPLLSGGELASAWSDASTWTVISDISADAGGPGQQGITCSFSGSLTTGGVACSTTVRTGPPPEGLAVTPGAPASGNIAFGTFWSMWTSNGCDVAFNDGLRCRAIRYFLGYSVVIYTLQSLVVLIGIAALFQVSEALLQMWAAPEAAVAGFRVPNLWQYFLPLLTLTGALHDPVAVRARQLRVSPITRATLCLMVAELESAAPV